MKRIIYIMLCIAFFGVSNYQIKANDDVDSIFLNDQIDLEEYIDVENIKAPTGDVYVNGVLTSNETGENYSINSDKTNATFMGKTRMEFGKNTSE